MIQTEVTKNNTKVANLNLLQGNRKWGIVSLQNLNMFSIQYVLFCRTYCFLSIVSTLKKLNSWRQESGKSPFIPQRNQGSNCRTLRISSLKPLWLFSGPWSNNNDCSVPPPLGTGHNKQLPSSLATFQPFSCPVTIARVFLNTQQPVLQIVFCLWYQSTPSPLSSMQTVGSGDKNQTSYEAHESTTGQLVTFCPVKLVSPTYSCTFLQGGQIPNP